MSLAIVHSRAQVGVSAPHVSVEAHLSNGLPSFTIVGLPETAVKESKDRVRSALLNSHFEFPAKRITVNLAPADLPKEGGRYDLAIAIGILAASDQIPSEHLSHYEFLGELALSGDVRGVHGAIPAALACGRSNRHLIVSQNNEAEASLCQSSEISLANNLLSVCAHLHQRSKLPKPKAFKVETTEYSNDMNEVKGQAQTKRALEIAAAGGHNLLMFGSPGTGKSMLASRLPSILPELNMNEAIEVASVQSVTASSSKYSDLSTHWRQRPFRSPHHTSSAVAIVGGGSHPKPGEISLAHRGVLFLDELPEFPRHVLEVMREPLETGEISISRANAQVTFPADFQLIAAMNPCPCGYDGDQTNTERCHCSPAQISRYRDKISGPLLDRIDLQVQVSNIPIIELQKAPAGESSDDIRQRVKQCRDIQLARQGCSNANLSGKALETHCALGEMEQQLLAKAMTRLNLSARAYDRILRVARTIADMTASDTINLGHLSEALGYRQLDRSEPARPSPRYPAPQPGQLI